jgi:hypothetical protein
MRLEVRLMKVDDGVVYSLLMRIMVKKVGGDEAEVLPWVTARGTVAQP